MKMPEKIESAMFAPCGMDCMVCYKHCYHKKSCAGYLMEINVHFSAFLNLAMTAVAILPTVSSTDTFCFGLRMPAGMMAVW